MQSSNESIINFTAHLTLILLGIIVLFILRSCIFVNNKKNCVILLFLLLLPDQECYYEKSRSFYCSPGKLLTNIGRKWLPVIVL